MKMLFALVAVIVVVACVGLAEEALAKQLQIVTARGNVFTMSDTANGTNTVTVINNTVTVINNTESGVGAGALGTSGRLVSIPHDGYLLYGDTRGEPGTIKDVEVFNWYDGTIDYVGFVPKQSTPTRYSLESPYGQYHVSSGELVNFGTNRYPIDIIGSSALEGGAPTIRDYNQNIEVDVNGKVLVQLDRSAFGERVLINVDVSTADISAQVVTSPNDLVNIPYRDFNGTGKFMLFEDETNREAEMIRSMGNARWRCGDYQGDLQYRCSNRAGAYAQIVSYLHNGKLKYFTFNAGFQNAIPFAADLHVSNLADAFADSDITTVVKYGCRGYRGTTVCTQGVDSPITSNATFANGLWHLTGFMQETQASVGFSWSRQGTTYTASANGIVAGNGTLRVTDDTPYVVRSNIDPFSSKGGVAPTNFNIYVLLDGTGTATIRANEVRISDEVEIHGLPTEVPWILETPDGLPLYGGITSYGSITMPIPEFAGEGADEFSLLIYEDGFGERVWYDDILLDLVNERAKSIDFDDATRNLIYIPTNYMLYPMTTTVEIDDIRLAEIRDDCSVVNQERLGYIEKTYLAGSSMHVPLIPGMSALKLLIEGTDTCIKFEDVVAPVQIRPFRGSEASDKERPLIDISASGAGSTVVASNEPVSIIVSFGASGYSEHVRNTLFRNATITGETGSMTCVTGSNHFAVNRQVFPSKLSRTCQNTSFGHTAWRWRGCLRGGVLYRV